MLVVFFEVVMQRNFFCPVSFPHQAPDPVPLNRFFKITAAHTDACFYAVILPPDFQVNYFQGENSKAFSFAKNLLYLFSAFKLFCFIVRELFHLSTKKSR